MTLTLRPPSSAAPQLSRPASVRLIAAAPELWRIVERDGRVIGHLQAVQAGADTRYRARMFHAPSRAFRDLGEFWSVDDAVECVVFAR
jgi:hypothetical protein